jgi:hypothetical protein
LALLILFPLALIFLLSNMYYLLLPLLPLEDELPEDDGAL